MDQTAFSMKFGFSKTGKMKYISHLDLMRLFARAGRRAGLDLTMTQGFNVHPRFRLERALKLGIESPCEHGEFFLNQPMAYGEFKERLSAQLPPEIQIKTYDQS